MKDFERITARDNRRLVDARKVRDGKVAGEIFIEGKRLAAEALRSPLAINACFVSDRFDDDRMIEKIRDRNALIATLSEKLFRSVADTDTPQGIILIAKRPSPPKVAVDKSRLPVTLYLSEVKNPSNLGAVLRSAEAAGVANVLISNNSADPFSPKALRASMGSAFRLRITTGCDLEKVVQLASQNDLRTTGAAAEGKISYADIDWTTPRVLVLGSEAHGLSDEQKKALDELICVPMVNGVESLNLAVSAGVILFEAKRQNG